MEYPEAWDPQSRYQNTDCLCSDFLIKYFNTFIYIYSLFSGIKTLGNIFHSSSITSCWNVLPCNEDWEPSATSRFRITLYLECWDYLTRVYFIIRSYQPQQTVIIFYNIGNSTVCCSNQRYVIYMLPSRIHSFISTRTLPYISAEK